MAVITSAVFVSACGESGPSPISRDEITAAFSSVEVLALEKDVKSTNAGSQVDAVYVPASNIIEPAFRIVLFNDEPAAEARARALQNNPKIPDFVHHQNAILIFRVGAAHQDREKLATVLSSLGDT